MAMIGYSGHIPLATLPRPQKAVLQSTRLMQAHALACVSHIYIYHSMHHANDRCDARLQGAVLAPVVEEVLIVDVAAHALAGVPRGEGV